MITRLLLVIHGILCKVLSRFVFVSSRFNLSDGLFVSDEECWRIRIGKEYMDTS